MTTSPGSASLLNAGKKFLLSLTNTEAEVVENNDSHVDERPALRRFKFFDDELKTSELPATSNNNDNILSQLNRYIMDASNVVCDNALVFWQHKKSCYSKQFMLGQDMDTAPASQAYVERIFQYVASLQTGRRNRMKKSLEMRVFHKLNKRIFLLNL